MHDNTHQTPCLNIFIGIKFVFSCISKQGQTVHKQRRCTEGQKCKNRRQKVETANSEYIKDTYENYTKLLYFFANLHFKKAKQTAKLVQTVFL